MISATQAFPPPNQVYENIELADPWEGVHAFAEDFYTGGDIRDGLLDPSTVNPSRLTPLRDILHNGEVEVDEYHLPLVDTARITPVEESHQVREVDVYEDPSSASSAFQADGPSLVDADMLEDEDEKDEDLAPDDSPELSENDDDSSVFPAHHSTGVANEENLDDLSKICSSSVLFPRAEFTLTSEATPSDQWSVPVSHNLTMAETASERSVHSPSLTSQVDGDQIPESPSAPSPGTASPKSIEIPFEDVDAEWEPDMDDEQDHAPAAQLSDLMHHNVQASVAGENQDLPNVVTFQANDQPSNLETTCPDSYQGGLLSPPIALGHRLRPATFSDTTAESQTEIASQDASLIPMATAETLTSPGDDGEESQSANPIDAASNAPIDHSTSTPDNLAATAQFGIASDDFSSPAGKVATVSLIQ